jgi:gamma-glutamyltranspeptidase / glutathione hydrolase
LLAVTCIAAFSFLYGIAGCSRTPPSHEPPAARQSLADRTGARHMVAAANPHAVNAGLEMLRRGGTAVDAAIAVQAVLGLVEAPETGLGGGGFLLYHDAAGGEVQFFDGRETAPAAARPERFLAWRRPLPRWFAITSGRAVGVPGLVAMLERAHRQHGQLPWPDLFEPAIRLAREGVPMPARLRAQVRADATLRFWRDTRQAFVGPAGDPAPELRNPAYAATLEKLAAHGARGFYEGPVADALVERARARGAWGSDITLQDLADYEARERAPVCGPYREWTVCGAPPPSSGGIAVLQILGLVERFALRELGPGSAEAMHLLVEAHRLAFADRDRYIGDPDFVDVPASGLVDPDYLARRSLLIDPARAR